MFRQFDSVPSTSTHSEIADHPIDPTIYYASLDQWPPARTLRTRLSGRLARRIPLHIRRLRNDRPMVSFTFDDAPESALVGAALLEQADARGSFYISTALLGLRTEHWRVIEADGVRDLHRRGHEIGLHGHRHLPVGVHSASQLADDIARNRMILQSVDLGIAAENFAYPYGQVSFLRKIQLAGLVRSSRGVGGGVNRSVLDIQCIRTVLLGESRLSVAELDFYLDQVVATNGWLVFLSHDVGDHPSPFGVSSRMLSYALEGSLRRRLLITTVDAALNAARVR